VESAVSTLLDYLSAWEAHPEHFAADSAHTPTHPAAPQTSAQLSPYAGLTRPGPQEATHERP
jgi:hypothetical protein